MATPRYSHPRAQLVFHGHVGVRRHGTQLREWAHEPADKRLAHGPLAEVTIRVAAALPTEPAGQTAPIVRTALAEQAAPQGPGW